jgi:hypothetical protein
MITETPEHEGGVRLTPDGSAMVVTAIPTDNVLVTVNVAPLLQQRD